MRAIESIPMINQRARESHLSFSNEMKHWMPEPQMMEFPTLHLVILTNEQLFGDKPTCYVFYSVTNIDLRV